MRIRLTRGTVGNRASPAVNAGTLSGDVGPIKVQGRAPRDRLSAVRRRSCSFRAASSPSSGPALPSRACVCLASVHLLLAAGRGLDGDVHSIRRPASFVVRLEVATVDLFARRRSGTLADEFPVIAGRRLPNAIRVVADLGEVVESSRARSGKAVAAHYRSYSPRICQCFQGEPSAEPLRRSSRQ
jgi:hypothetical protein